MAERVVPVVVRVSGGKEGAAEVRRIQSAFDELNRADFSHARQALTNLGGPENLRQIQQQARAARETSQAVGQTASVSAGKIKELSDRLGDAGEKISRFGTSLTAVLTLPIAAATALGLRFNATKEQAIQAFTVLLRDGEKAKQLFNDLQTFADTTPFESPEVVSGAKGLLAYGVALQDLKPLLKDAGDLAAGMGVQFEEVTRAFGRLKAGDFGEAFERFRDFGISRQELEGKGLKFDKSGQFVGSVSQAMDAVRAIVQEKFGGMMDKQSQTFSGRISTLLDTANRALGDLTAPVFALLSSALPYLIEVFTRIKEAIGKLPDSVKLGISAFLGLLAAIGPVLVVLGGLITAIAGVVASWGAIVLAVKVLAVALVALPFILAQVAVFLGAVGVAAYTLYQVWTRNLGGVRDFALQVFGVIRAFISNALSAIYGFWQAHGQEILATVKNLYEGVLGVIGAVLGRIIGAVKVGVGAVTSFWQAHGQQIKAIAATAWAFVVQIVNYAARQLAAVFKLITQVVNGDWAGAWQTFLQIVRNAAEFAVTYLKYLAAQIPNVLRFLGSLLANEGATAFGWLVKAAAYAVGRALFFLATLPYQIARLIPYIIAAAKDIGLAIWEGIKAGLTGGGAASGTGNLVPTLGFDLNSLIPNFDALKNAMTGANGARSSLNAGLDETSKKHKREKTELERLTEDYQKAAQELAGLRAFTREAQLGVGIELLQQQKSELQEVIRLRIELNKRLNESLPQTDEATKAELRQLNAFKEAQNAVKQLADEFRQSNAAINNPDPTPLERAKATLAEYKKQGIVINENNEKQLLLNASLLEMAQNARTVTESVNDIGKALDQRIANLRQQVGLALLDPALRQAAEVGFEFKLPQNATPEQVAEINEKKKQYLDLLRQQRELETRQAADKGYLDKVKEYQELLRGNVELTARQQLELDLQKPQLAALTEEERERLRVLADQVDARKQFDELTRQLSDSFNRILTAGVKGGFKGLLRAAFDEIKNFGLTLLNDLIKNISQSLARTVAGGLLGGGAGSGGSAGGGIFGSILGSIGKLFGLGGSAARTPNFNPNATSGGGGGGILGTIGNPFGGLFGLGGNAARTPGFNPNASNFLAPAAATGTTRFFGPGSLGQLFGAAATPASLTAQAAQRAAQQAVVTNAVKAANANLNQFASPTVRALLAGPGAAGRFSFGALGQSLAAAAPLLGLSLGALAGGQSGLGQILGGAGGLLGGLVLAASTGAIGGSLGSLFALSGALGPAALVAAPLLILGAVLLGKAKQRRADEQARDQLSGSIGDALTQAEQTIRRASQASEITATLAQAQARFDEYLAQVNAIKTRSVRESALRNQVPVHRQHLDALNQLAQRREAGLALDAKLVGEFATGGTFRVPGLYRGVDDHYLKVASGERVIVLTPDQDREATPFIAPYLKRARVPGFAEGGSNLPAPRTRNDDEAPIEVNLTLLLSNKVAVGPSESAEILVQALDTDTGRRANVRVIQKAITDDEIDPNRRRR